MMITPAKLFTCASNKVEQSEVRDCDVLQKKFNGERDDQKRGEKTKRSFVRERFHLFCESHLFQELQLDDCCQICAEKTLLSREKTLGFCVQIYSSKNMTMILTYDVF